jgi:hypothetical protein
VIWELRETKGREQWQQMSSSVARRWERMEGRRGTGGRWLLKCCQHDFLVVKAAWQVGHVYSAASIYISSLDDED